MMKQIEKPDWIVHDQIPWQIKFWQDSWYLNDTSLAVRILV